MRERLHVKIAKYGLILGVLIVLVAPTVWLLVGGTRGAEVANVLALPVGGVGILLSLASANAISQAVTTEQVNAALADLRRRIAKEESQILQRLLADDGHPAPADLTFTLRSGLPERTNGGKLQGTLDDIGAYYADLTLGRLAVIGAPGAGKTVLAIQLVLQLTHLGWAQLPVRINLATLTAGPGNPADRLRALLVDELIRHLGQRPALARKLVDEGHVLPVLDGLDEMDSDLLNRPRAAEVVAALSLGPFVLTCRAEQYTDLQTRPDDTTVVVAESLRPEQVVDWLRHRFPDAGHGTGVQRRWRAVVTRITSYPGGALAKALCRPLTLYLAIAKYREPNSEPRILAELRKEEIDEHLVSGAVAAAVRHQAYRDDHLDEQAVTRWLVHIAGRMTRSGTGDLRLDTLWPSGFARNWQRWLALAAAGVVLVLPFAAAFGFAVVNESGTAVPMPDKVREAAAVAGVLLFVVYRATRHGPLYRRFRHRRPDRYVLKLGLLIAALILVVGLSSQTPKAATVFLTVAVYGMFVLHAFSSRDAGISSPRRIVRDGVVYDLAIATWFGLVPLTSVSVDFFRGLGTTEIFYDRAFAFGLFIALGIVIRCRSPWLGYLIAVTRQAQVGLAPFRFAEFLEWTGRAGLTRMSGAAMQFRHREIQDWLRSQLPLVLTVRSNLEIAMEQVDADINAKVSVVNDVATKKELVALFGDLRMGPKLVVFLVNTGMQIMNERYPDALVAMPMPARDDLTVLAPKRTVDESRRRVAEAIFDRRIASPRDLSENDVADDLESLDLAQKIEVFTVIFSLWRLEIGNLKQHTGIA